MKNKPISHKAENTFKFLTFAERLNNVNIDVIHRIGKTPLNPEDANSFFQEAIEKWNDLNYTTDYDSLRNAIGYDINTLSQIVHKKDELIKTLIEHLQKPENMALDAILEFTVALSRDLQFEFYPYFPQFLRTFIQLLETKDMERLERIFTCLSYLFKFLWRYMIKDIKNVYRLYSSLLASDNKEYIRSFAAESFAFLIRKVQDKPKFFRFVFCHLEKNTEHVEGLGCLFFETIKGVKRQFHSCAKMVLNLLLKELGKGCSLETKDLVDLPYSLVMEALQHMFATMQRYTSKEHVVVVEEAFRDIIEQIIQNLTLENIKKEDASDHLCRVLHLMESWISHADGLLLSEDSVLFQILEKLCKLENLPDNCMEPVVEITAVLMKSKNVDISVSLGNTLLAHIFKLESRKLVFNFTQQLFDYGLFEKDVLPRLLEYCVKIIPLCLQDVLHIMTKTIIYLRPSNQSWEDMKPFIKLQICSKEKSSCVEILEKCFLDLLEKTEFSYETLPQIWHCLVCLPHFKSTNVSHSLELVSQTVKSCSSWLAADGQTDHCRIKSYLFVLCRGLLTLLHLEGRIDDLFSLSFIMDLLKKYPTDVSLLQMFEVFLNHSDVASVFLLDEEFQVFVRILTRNLASPFHKVRLLSLQLLCIYPFTLPANEEGVTEDETIFNLCLSSERIAPTIAGYRDKLKWIRKLDVPSVRRHLPLEVTDECSKAPIYYLLGLLYVNFSLLWEQALELLQSYADNELGLFWRVFKPYLYEIVECAEKHNLQDKQIEVKSNSRDSDCVFFEILDLICTHSENPDIINHRLLLWKSMAMYPSAIRQKNADVVPLLFRFIEKEVAKIEDSLAVTEPVSAIEDESTLETEEVVEDVEEQTNEDTEEQANEDTEEQAHEDSEEQIKVDIDESEPAHKKMKLEVSLNEETVASPTSDSFCNAASSEPTSGKRKRKKSRSPNQKNHQGAVKTLSAILTLFSKLKKPATVHRTDELKKLYYELLSYHHCGIQKLAYDCIMTYNFEFLIPYKENFYKILDDKTFKSEIVLFGIGKDSQVIEEKHRTESLNVLMRILYGKMLRKTGNNTSGKGQAHLRRTLVLRFLAGCHADELKMFFDLAFEPLKDQLDVTILTAVQNIKGTLDLTSIIPIRKLRSTLNTLEVVLNNLGSLAPDLLPWFLKVILVIATMSTCLLEKRQELLSHCVTLIKFIKKQATMTLIQFFKSFDRYNYSPEEIDAIFEAVIWPALPRLQYEALIQPPPLLRLLDTWSSNSRYFVLLTKHHASSKTSSPLHHIMSLYVANKARPRVVGLISKMIHSLLTLEHFSQFCEHGEIIPIAVNNSLMEDDALSRIETEEDDFSFGMQLLLPHVDSILKRLQIIVRKASKHSNRSLESRELTILLRISSYVEEATKCHQLIELLLPFFSHQKKLNGDCKVLVLSTINNLIGKVEKPTYFVKFLAPLFGILSSHSARSVLVEIFITISKKDETLINTAQIVQKINAWNPNYVEEPDYQTRLDGHAEALSLVNVMDEDISCEFIQIIVCNSTFVIRTCDDTSLRSSASYLLQNLTKKFAEFMDSRPDVFKVLAFDIFLPDVQKGLKNKTEVVRFEFIRILSALLKNCGNHEKLSQLAQLCNSDTDMDFWENILHLQVHRRARALLKFSGQLNSGELNLHPHVLRAYVIPIVSSFFFDAAYKKHIHVIDAAIETFGVIAKRLNWHSYESTLRHYLNLLSRNVEDHKTIVKIIVSILNAFHFDLSASRGVRQNAKITPPDKEKKTEEDFNDDGAIGCKENISEVTNEKVVFDEEEATKLHRTIVRNILPQLNRSLMHKSKSDDEHKLAGHHYPEDEEVLRVPIALAIVKLLQNLPHDSLKRSISGLFLKMCHLLKSRAESIRYTARDTLVKMMTMLGSKYFNPLLQEMKSVMKKGYQVHVMSFTINSVLQTLKSESLLKSGDLDSAVTDLIQVCLNELFGETAEEKEVAKITGKLKEARSNKSYNICEILSQFVSESCLMQVITPLKEVLDTARSHKSVKKIHECLKHIAQGFSENTGITEKIQLIFIHELVSENLQLMCHSKSTLSCPQKYTKYVRPDIYLIPQEPGRGAPVVKSTIKTNCHVVVDFSLQLLYLWLKRDRLNSSDQGHLEMLDPFVQILADCLDSNHINIISTSLRCLLWLFKFALPTLKTLSTQIVCSSFVLLNKYAGVGMGQGENFEMVVMCFKMLTVIVRDTNYYELNKDQLRVLLSYIEQDIHDHTRQATAFTLLKAILSKKLQTPELAPIMSKISEMAITAEQDHIRTQSRQASIVYLTHYPLGKVIHQSLTFYLSQLEYSHEHGRLSALDVINLLLNSFSPNIVKKYYGMIFVPLAARLVNDEASKCRKIVASTIKTLISLVDYDCKNQLFTIVTSWMESDKLPHQRLAVQLCGIFAEVEGQDFERFLKDILPFFKNHLGEAKSSDVVSSSDVRCKDHFTYHILNSFTKVLSHCKIIKNEKYDEELNLLWEYFNDLLLHSHFWVRVAAAQLFGILFSSYSIDEVLDTINGESKQRSIFFASRQKLRDLSADFATQLQSPYLMESFGEQIIRNLIYLAKVISRLPDSPLENYIKDDINIETNKTLNDNLIEESDINNQNEDENNGSQNAKGDNDSENEDEENLNEEDSKKDSFITQVSISWMIRKLSHIVKKEVAFTPQSSVKRKCIFKFFAAIAIDLDKDKLRSFLPVIITPLCRELTVSTTFPDESLTTLTKEVLEVLKTMTGVEEYTKVYSSVQSCLLRKKVKRKQDRVKEAVTDPEKFAKKKIKKQLNKKESKKRKLRVLKGKPKGKKPKLSDLAIES